MATLSANCDMDYFATLTDEHASCSYGLPVVVGNDGQVYGPLEAGVVQVRPLGEEDVEEITLVEAARQAGYQVYA